MSDTYSIRDALESTETKGTVLHAILRKQYGDDAYEWDLATIAMEVSDDFGASISSESANRWAAMQIVMTTDAFFTRLDAFMTICNVLASGEPFFDMFDPVTTEEAAWAIAEVALNREMLPFSSAIKRFLKLLLKYDGYGDAYPEIFDTVFEADTPEQATAVRRQVTQRKENEDVIDELIDEELADLVMQFDKIPSLQGVDNLLLSDSGNTLVESLK